MFKNNSAFICIPEYGTGPTFGQVSKFEQVMVLAFSSSFPFLLKMAL